MKYKNKLIIILLIVLIIMQINSSIQLNDMRIELQRSQNNINHLVNDMQNMIANNHVQINEMLQQQENPIGIASFDIGNIADNEYGEHLVPITFTVIPKEVSANTEVSLTFASGENIPMEKNDTTFTTTIDFDMFANIEPIILLYETGTIMTVKDDRINIGSLVPTIFPHLYVNFFGTSSVQNNLYRATGSINANVFNRSISTAAVYFTQMRFVVSLDSEILYDEMIADAENYDHNIDLSIPMENDRVLTLSVIATDNLGFEHHVLVDSVTAGADRPRDVLIPRFTLGAEIFSPDGQLVWSPPGVSALN